MFLYVAVLAALVGSADAAGFDNLHHVPAAMDVQKYIQYAKEHPAEATAPHARNLRDMVKPDDTVYHMFRDPACTIPQMKSVRHGNTCYRDMHSDTTSSMSKVGCMVDANNNLMAQYFDYGQSPDCASEPLAMMTMPAVFNGPTPTPTPVRPGDCVDIGNGQYARMFCSKKDPFRDGMGYHVLNFETDQVKECHDNSIKTNRAHSHSFLTGGECVSMDPGKSIMPVSCGPGKVEYREDPNSETCANLGPIMSHQTAPGCQMDQQHDDQNGNNGSNGIMKEFCVDETTGPQQ